MPAERNRVGQTMPRRLHIPKAALADIDETGLSTWKTFGERQAERHAETIDSAIAEIAADPTNVRARHRTNVHPDARTIHISRRGLHASHASLYRIRTDGAIENARDLHDLMDLRRHLPDEFGHDA